MVKIFTIRLYKRYVFLFFCFFLFKFYETFLMKRSLSFLLGTGGHHTGSIKSAGSLRMDELEVYFSFFFFVTFFCLSLRNVSNETFFYFFFIVGHRTGSLKSDEPEVRFTFFFLFKFCETFLMKRFLIFCRHRLYKIG